MADKVWNERDYQLALSIVGSIKDPAEKDRITRKLRQYEQGKITGTGFTGVQALEAAGLPATEEEKPPDIGAVTKATTVTPKAGKVGKGRIPSLWHEPSLERFKLDMVPVAGVAVEEMTESSPLYKAYADRKWNEAAEKADKAGETLTRVSQMPTETWQDKAAYGLARARDFADTALLGLDETATAGIGNRAATSALEGTGLDPEASAKAEEALARNPITRGIGNVAGYFNPLAPAMLGGRAAINFVGPKLGALAAKTGVPQLAAKAGTAAAAGAAALTAEGAAQDILPEALFGTVGETMVNPFDPMAFATRRADEAKLGAAAGPAAEVLGATAGKLAGKLGERAKSKAQQAVSGLSESDLARIGMLVLGGWKAPAAMAAAGRSGPALEQVAKLQSVRGLNPFIPGFPGGAMASPFSPESASQAPSDMGDREVIQRAIEEATKEQPTTAPSPAESPDDIPEGYEVAPEEPTQTEGDTVPIGMFSGVPDIEAVGDLAVGIPSLLDPKTTPRASAGDPEFQAVLKSLKKQLRAAGKSDDDIADVLDGYVRNYPRWRAMTDEAKKEGDPNPFASVASTGRFDTKGFIKPGEETVAANPQVGTELDDESTERAAMIPASARADFEKALPEQWTAEDVVREAARRVAVGATVPRADMVFDSIKQLGFNVPMSTVKQVLRSYQELTL